MHHIASTTYQPVIDDGTRNGALAAAWLQWMTDGELSPHTINLRRTLLNTFARGHDLATATYEDVRAHLASRPGGAWSRASHLATLRSFYRFAVRAGLVDHDPTMLLHPIRVPPRQLDPIPDAVLGPALARADERTRFMMLLASREGLRRAEIAGLHSDDISQTHLTITGKGGRVRRVPIHRSLRPYLDGVRGWAFPSPEGDGPVTPDTVGRAIAKATGGWTAHSLRRYFATRAYEGSRDIRAVQELLGHSSPATTARYVKAGEGAMRAAVDAVA